MKEIIIDLHNTRSLEQLGISVLTGERDNTMTGRLLCDLNEQGKKLIHNYFSIPIPHNQELYPYAPFENAWNQRVGDQPALACIMLHHSMFRPLVIFGLIVTPGVQYVYANDTHITGTDDDSIWLHIDATWEAARTKAKALVGEGHPNFYETTRNQVPDCIRLYERWRGTTTINQVHQMTQRA